MSKIKVGILFGGKSAEHEVSLQSAKNVIEAIDKEKYEIILIGVDKDGKWYLVNDDEFLSNMDDPSKIKLNKNKNLLAIIPGERKNQIINLNGYERIGDIDVIFPILHGPFGEDGTIQGLLKLSNIAYVGADVLGSAVGMDKDVMKRLLRDSFINIADFLSYNNKEEYNYELVKERLGMPVFIKPANLGSSVGISKAHTEEEFYKAMKLAFEFDNKVIVEEAIKGREIECSVLGNNNPICSLPGEILPATEFYSYESKYIDESGAALQIPAKLSDKEIEEIRACSIKTYKTLCCTGMARVDVFLKDNGDIIVNEINTIPGFTKISMYPKLWDISNIKYSDLIDKLIELAIERHKEEKKLKTSL